MSVIGINAKNATKAGNLVKIENGYQALYDGKTGAEITRTGSDNFNFNYGGGLAIRTDRTVNYLDTRASAPWGTPNLGQVTSGTVYLAAGQVCAAGNPSATIYIH